MSRATNPIAEPSVTCGFFNSRNDRKYDALQMSSIFDGIIRDGIFASIGSCFVVTADGTNTVYVGTGKAWFNHTWTKNDAVLPVICEDSEVLLERIDAVVIEVNSNVDVRDNFIKVVKGVPSDSPTNPVLTNTDEIHQHALCYIRRIAGSTGITQAEITNVIGTDETPFVTGILDVISMDTLLGQWSSQLDQFVSSEQQEIIEWFNTIKSQISSDDAVNLQLQIDDIKSGAGLTKYVDLDGKSLIDYVKNLGPSVHTSFQFHGATDTPNVTESDTGDYKDTNWYYADVHTHVYGSHYFVIYLTPLVQSNLPTYRGLYCNGSFTGWEEIITSIQFDDLKQYVVNGKTSVANAINGHLGTTLSDQNAFSELASYITNNLRGKLVFSDGSKDISDGVSDNWFTFSNASIVIVMVRVSSGVGGAIDIKTDKPGRVAKLGYGMDYESLSAGVTFEYLVTCPSSDSYRYGFCVVVCEEPATIQAKSIYGTFYAMVIA